MPPVIVWAIGAISALAAAKLFSAASRKVNADLDRLRRDGAVAKPAEQLERDPESGVYRPRKAAETHVTSSPSMDISKASNFERFVFDLVGRDPAKVAELWKSVDAGGSFDLSGSEAFARIGDFAFVSGRSSHANRLDTIRKIDRDYGVVIDTHTADGVKVGLAHREVGVPLVCLETALPAKFEATIVEALGRAPERPAGYENIEAQPQRCEVMDIDAQAVKAFIEKHAG